MIQNLENIPSKVPHHEGKLCTVQHAVTSQVSCLTSSSVFELEARAEFDGGRVPEGEGRGTGSDLDVVKDLVELAGLVRTSLGPRRVSAVG